MYDPPAGYEDFLADAERANRGDGPMHPIEVEGVGTILARNTIPGSAAALGAAGGSGFFNLF